MKNITILDQSFFDSKKKIHLAKKKVFGDTTFHLSKKKILDSGVRSISNKTFFFGMRHKKTKKLTAQKSLCSQYFLTTAVSKKGLLQKTRDAKHNDSGKAVFMTASRTRDEKHNDSGPVIF